VVYGRSPIIIIGKRCSIFKRFNWNHKKECSATNNNSWHELVPFQYVYV